ncbi:glyoxalase-like domain protein [Synechococcus elongatus IITB4]|uniref:glyoxalase-like domain protein n=1 Tax=Synechococcus elongatus TaxID=32046 RepID=UPI0030CE2837
MISPLLWASLVPWDLMFSTQGIMIGLLAAYAGALWLFLSSTPKVHTVLVSDLAQAQIFYERVLGLAAADVPLNYYYNTEQGLAGLGYDGALGITPPSRLGRDRLQDGLWYRLKRKTQLHVVAGANPGDRQRLRQVSFDRDGLQQILSRIQAQGLPFKLKRQLPLLFLVKDWEGQVIEFEELEV